MNSGPNNSSGPNPGSGSVQSSYPSLFRVAVKQTCHKFFDKLKPAECVWGVEDKTKLFRVHAEKSALDNSRNLLIELLMPPTDCLSVLGEVIEILKELSTERNVVFDLASYKNDLLKPLSQLLKPVPVNTSSWTGSNFLSRKLKEALKSRSEISHLEVRTILVMLTSVLKKLNASPQKLLEHLENIMKIWTEIFESEKNLQDLMREQKDTMDNLIGFTEKAFKHENVVSQARSHAGLSNFLQQAPQKLAEMFPEQLDPEIKRQQAEPLVQKEGFGNILGDLYTPANSGPLFSNQPDHYQSFSDRSQQPHQVSDSRVNPFSSEPTSQNLENLKEDIRVGFNPFEDDEAIVPPTTGSGRFTHTEGVMDTGDQPDTAAPKQDTRSVEKGVKNYDQHAQSTQRRFGSSGPQPYYQLKASNTAQQSPSNNQTYSHGHGSTRHANEGERVHPEEDTWHRVVSDARQPGSTPNPRQFQNHGPPQSNNEYPSLKEAYSQPSSNNSNLSYMKQQQSDQPSTASLVTQPLITILDEVLSDPHVTCQSSFIVGCNRHSQFVPRFFPASMVIIKHATRNINYETVRNFLRRNHNSPNKIEWKGARDDIHEGKNFIFQWLLYYFWNFTNSNCFRIKANIADLTGELSTTETRSSLLQQMHLNPERFQAEDCAREELLEILSRSEATGMQLEFRRILIRAAVLVATCPTHAAGWTEKQLTPNWTVSKLINSYLEELASRGIPGNRELLGKHMLRLAHFEEIMSTETEDTLETIMKTLHHTMHENGGHLNATQAEKSMYILTESCFPDFIKNCAMKSILETGLKDASGFESLLSFFYKTDRQKEQEKLSHALSRHFEQSLFHDCRKAMIGLVTRPNDGPEAKALAFIDNTKKKGMKMFLGLHEQVMAGLRSIFDELVSRRMPCRFVLELAKNPKVTLELLEMCRQDTKYVSKNATAAEVTKVLEHTQQVVAAAREHTLLLEALASNREQAFTNLDQDKIRKDYQLLKNDESVTVFDIEDSMERLSNCQAIKRSSSLIQVKQYQDHLRESAQEAARSRHKKLSASEFESLCKKSEEHIQSCLIPFLTSIDHYKLAQFKKFRSALSGQERTSDGRPHLLVANGIITEPERVTLFQMTTFAEVLPSCEKLLDSFEQVIQTLTDKKKLFLENKKEFHKQDDLCYKTIEQVVRVHREIQAKLSSKPQHEFVISDLFWGDDIPVLEYLYENEGNLQHLGGCMEVLKHFVDKEPRHFQDLYFESDGPIRIDPHITNAAQSLVFAFKSKDSFNGLKEFLDECFTKKFKLQTCDLASKAKDLIECSKTHLSDNLDGKRSAFQILEQSVIVFRVDQNLSDYDVFCETQLQLDDIEDGQIPEPVVTKTVSQKTHPDKKSRDPKVSFDKLKDTKIKVSLYKDHLKRQEEQRIKLNMDEMMVTDEKETLGNRTEDTKLIDLYECIIDSVQSIMESLVKIVRSGTIYDLEAIFKRKAKQMMQQDSSAFGQPDLDQTYRHFFSNSLSLYVQTNTRTTTLNRSHGRGEPKQNHFEVLRAVFKKMEAEAEELMINRSLRFHNITSLRSFQKIMLCRYLAFNELDGVMGRKSPDFEEITSIFKFMLPKQPSKITLGLIQKWRLKCDNYRDLDGYTDKLLMLFHEDLEGTDRDFIDLPVEEVAVDKIRSTEGADLQKKIKFFEASEDTQYKSFLDLVTLKGEKQPAPQRVFFCNQTTSIYDIKNFLVCALSDPSRKFYSMLDLNLLNPEIQGELILACKLLLQDQQKVLNNNLTLILVSKSGSNSELRQHLGRNPDYFEPDAEEQKGQKNTLTPGFEVFTSERAGLGKTTTIEKRATDGQKTICTLLLSGESCKEGLSSRLAKLASTYRQVEGEIVLHIKLDSMDDMQISCKYVDQFLFNVIYLKCVPYKRGYLFSDRVKATFVEVQNSYKELLLREVRMLSFVKAKNLDALTVSRFQSEFDPRLVSKILRRVEAEDVEDMDQQTQDPDLADRMWRFLDIFINSYKARTFGTGCLQLEELPGAAPRPQTTPSSIVLELIKLISHNDRDVQTIIGNASYTQIIYWLNTVYFQLSELDKVSGLNPAFYSGPQCSQAMLRDLATLREKTAKSVIELAKQLVWSVADSINKEVVLAKQIYQNVQNHKGDMLSFQSKELKEYEKVVQSIPRWELGSQVNYFFFKGAMKVIYQDPLKVDHSIREVVKNQTKHELPDYRHMPDANGKLTTELLEALSMETDSQLASQLQQDVHWRTQQADKRISMYLQDKMNSFNGKGYAITHDSYMKILMIVQRAMLGIPVVIMGGTGCGKTYMIDFIGSSLFRETFVCFTMHTGVTEEDLTNELFRVHRLSQAEPRKRIWFLFDEFNTSPLQCLISEIIIERRSSFCLKLAGIRFSQNIIFVAACNPFRIKVQTSQVGLIHESSVSLLSHRVYPIPESLISNIWDFGQLTKDVEEKYIHSMVNNHSKLRDCKVKSDIISCIQICQEHFRSGSCENTVSLRDVNRFIELFDFLKKFFTQDHSLVVTVGLCYIFRLETKKQKTELSEKLDQNLKRTAGGTRSRGQMSRYDDEEDELEPQNDSTKFADVMKYCMDVFAADLRSLKVLPAGITLNKPLLENLIATWVCILTKTPLIICGKPGTSKTLSIRVIGDALNLQHERRADSVFFGPAPRVTFRNFWGSLTTTSNSIRQVFNKAEDIVRNIHTRANDPNDPAQGAVENDNVCIVFDEIGLAEIAPDNPLKVLHPLLEPKERKVGFIGLSNWRLDLSKMNRVLYVARPDMDADDLYETCDVKTFIRSLEGKANLQTRFKPIITERFLSLSKAYYKFRIEEMKSSDPGTHPNFHGSRDFYETVKIFKRNLKFFIESKIKNKDEESPQEELQVEDQEIVDGLLLNALQRNFSGKMLRDQKSHEQIMGMYLKEIKRFSNSKVSSAPAIELIYQNLIDESSRHLMILSSMNVVQDLVVDQITEFETTTRKKDHSKVVYLTPSKDKEDMIQVIKSKLPVYIKNGYTVIMKDLNELYGCMYDLLNQNYTKREQEGEWACDLFIDNISQQVTVHPEFKCIILMDELDRAAVGKDVEKKQQPPFFNRFEKYIITEEDFIPKQYSQIKDELLRKLQFTSDQSKAPRSKELPKPQCLYHNLSREMVFSIVVKDASEVKKKLKFEYKDKMSILKLLLEQTTVYSKQSTETEVSQALPDANDTDIEEKVIRLHSRNCLLFRELSSKSVGEYQHYHRTFLRTHPHDSLLDLQINLDSHPQDKRAVVFTYSSAFELREIVGNYPKTFQLFEATELHTRYTSRQESCFREILVENNKTLVVQFTKKKDWHLMQQIKFGIDKAITETKKLKPVIFVAQYCWGDFNLPMGEYHCGITYFTQNWQMQVIDNLKGCQYQKFLELIQLKCHDVLEQQQQETGTNMLQDAISRYFLHNSKEYADLVRGDSCKEMISKSPLLLEMIKQETLGAIKSGKSRKSKSSDTVLGLFQGKNYSDLFSNQNDCYYLVHEALRNLFLSETKKSIKKIEENVNIRNLILLKNLKEEYDLYSREFLEVTTSEGLNPTNRVSSTKGSVDPNVTMKILDSIRALNIKSPVLLKDMRRHIIEIQNLSAALSRSSDSEKLKEFFKKLRLGICQFVKMDDKYFGTTKALNDSKDPRHAILAAIHLFQEFLKHHDKELLQYPIFEIILHVTVQILDQIFPQKSVSECDYTFREATVTMIFVCRVYAEEFKAISSFVQESLTSAKELEHKLKREIVGSIMATGGIDLQHHISSIQKLKPIGAQGLSELAQQLSRIKLSYRLSLLVKKREASGASTQANSRRAQQEATMDTGEEDTPNEEEWTSSVTALAFSDHQIALKIIEFTLKHYESKEQILQEIYNEACQLANQQDNPFEVGNCFAMFGLHFLRLLLESQEIPLNLTRLLLKQLSSHLLDLDQHKPDMYFSQIARILLLVIKRCVVFRQLNQPAEGNGEPDLLDIEHETLPEMIVLSKLAIFNICPTVRVQDQIQNGQYFSQMLTRVVEESSTIGSLDNQTKQRFYQKLNHRIICFASASSQNFGDKGSRSRYRSVVEHIQIMSDVLCAERPPSVFDNRTITAFAVFKSFLEELKTKDLPLEVLTRVDQECKRVCGTERTGQDKKFGLVLFHAIYASIPSIKRLREKGLPELAKTLQSFQDSSDKEFVLPSPALRGQLQAFAAQDIPFLNGAPQMMAMLQPGTEHLSSFHFGIHLSNKLFSSSPRMEDIAHVLPQIEPGAYKSFIDALLLAGFGTNQFTTADDPDSQLNELLGDGSGVFEDEGEQPDNPFADAPLRTTIAQADQQASRQLGPVPQLEVFRQLTAIEDGSLKENLHFYLSVGLVLNFVANLPDSFAYSPTAATAPRNLRDFLPMLNYPSPGVLKYQVISRFHELSKSSVGSAGGRIFTALWECATPNCGYLIPIGDCGNLGHGTTDNISGKCVGCKQPIGTLTGGGNSNLVRRDLDSCLRKFRDDLSIDETPYRPEPRTEDGQISRTFDDSWLLMKYFEDISDRSTAIFMNFVQNVVIYGIESANKHQPFEHLLRLDTRRMGDTEKLLVRDYELLRDVLARDDQSLFEIFNLVFFEVFSTIQAGEKLCSTPRGLRSKLGKTFSKVALLDKQKRPSRALEDYYEIKQSLINTEKKRMEKVMALLSGKLPIAQVKKEFYSDQVFGFYLNRADAKVNIEMIDNKLQQRINALTESKASPVEILKCTFIQHIINNTRVLTNLRRILMGLKKFSNFLLHKYDSLFTKSAAKELKLQELLRPKPPKQGDVIGERVASCADDLLVEYNEFKRLIQEIIDDHQIFELIKYAYKFECQRVDHATQSIKSLLQDKTTFITFLIYEERDKDDPEPVLKMLMEALIEFQTKWITTFSDLNKELAEQSQNSKANLLLAPEESVMCLGPSFQTDLYRHSYANTTGLNARSELIIDIDFLSGKYMTYLFGQTQQLEVKGMFSFQDSRNRELGALIQRFFKKYDIVEETDPECVAPLHIGNLDIEGLIVSLKVLLTQALDTHLSESDAAIQAEQRRVYHSRAKLSVLNNDDLNILSQALENYCLKDLNILREFIQLAQYPSLAEKLNEKHKPSPGSHEVFRKNYEAKIAEGKARIKPEFTQQWIKKCQLIMSRAIPFEVLEDHSSKQKLEASAEDCLEEDDFSELKDLLDILNISSEQDITAFTLRHMLWMVNKFSD